MNIGNGAKQQRQHIGSAGWSIPKEQASHFGEGDSLLERYATRFNAVEINSSFYRPHRAATYARWAATAPGDFQFAVKMPRELTHIRRLKDSSEPLSAFLMETMSLGHKLGPLLIQLPPGLSFEPKLVESFFADLRQRFSGALVCEPRHPHWFTAKADDMLKEFKIARVAVDPAVVPQAARPGGWPGLIYYRLHGSPVIYRSAYSNEYLSDLAGKVQSHQSAGVPVWCIFDNTAEGAGTLNALEFVEMMS